MMRSAIQHTGVWRTIRTKVSEADWESYSEERRQQVLKNFGVMQKNDYMSAHKLPNLFRDGEILSPLLKMTSLIGRPEREMEEVMNRGLRYSLMEWKEKGFVILDEQQKSW